LPAEEEVDEGLSQPDPDEVEDVRVGEDLSKLLSERSDE
jgi:hypothetical protein